MRMYIIAILAALRRLGFSRRYGLEEPLPLPIRLPKSLLAAAPKSTFPIVAGNRRGKKKKKQLKCASEGW